MNCIQEGLIPLRYYEKSSKRLTQANGENLIINYKIPNVHICHDGTLQQNVFLVTKISEEIFFVAKNTALVTKYELRH